MDNVNGANKVPLGELGAHHAGGEAFRYPYRSLQATFWQQFQMLADRNNGYDVRPQLVGYLSFDSFLDPLSGKVKLGPDDTKPGSQVFSPYALWFGLAYPTFPGLKRIGDRLTWTETSSQGTVTSRFNVLAADQDLIGDGTNISGSHPDNTGVLSVNQVIQDVGTDISGVGGSASQFGRFTISRWINATDGQYQRGPIDRNFAFGDGSVTRLTALAWDDYNTSTRTTKIPGILSTGGYPPCPRGPPPAVTRGDITMRYAFKVTIEREFRRGTR